MSIERFILIKQMTDMQEDTRCLVKKMRLQNRVARAQRGGLSPLRCALVALGQRLERYGQQWLPLLEAAPE